MAQTEQLGKFLVEFGAFSFRLIRRHMLMLLGAAGAVALVMTVFGVYKSIMTEEIVILGGPAGGSGIELANIIARDLEETHSSVFGRRYIVRVESTSGYSENVRRIQMDKSGGTVGLAHNGFEDATNVRALIPLDTQYMHIICKDTLFNTVFNQFASRELEPSLSRILEFIDARKEDYRSKVYLGPRGSGTRHLAEIILRTYGKDPSDYETHGVSDWYELQSAMATGDIELAFNLGPRLTSSVMRIASSGHTQLLSIDNAQAIADQNESLGVAEFSSGSYTSTFCPHPCSTVSAKRVFACSDQLGTTSAFGLANRIKESLSLKSIGWGDDEESEKGYGLHEGARLLRSEKSPGWVEDVTYAWLTFGVWIVFSIIAEAARYGNAALGKMFRPETESHSQTSESPRDGDEMQDIRQNTDVEEVGEQLASDVRDQLQFSQLLDSAIKGMNSRHLSDEVRLACLEIVAKYADVEEKALDAISKLSQACYGKSDEFSIEVSKIANEISTIDESA